MKKLINAVALDVVFAVTIYLWQWRHIDGAGNVAAMLGWVISVLYVLAGLSGEVSRTYRGLVLALYVYLSTLATIFAFAWFDRLGIATTMLVGFLLMEGQRAKARESNA